MVGEAASVNEANALVSSAGHVTQALKCGAHGYLTKHSEPEEVIDGIRREVAGKRVFSPDIADVVVGAPFDGDALRRHLTPWEFDVLRLLVHSESIQDIARSMHLRPKTVLNYMCASHGETIRETKEYGKRARTCL